MWIAGPGILMEIRRPDGTVIYKAKCVEVEIPCRSCGVGKEKDYQWQEIPREKETR